MNYLKAVFWDYPQFTEEEVVKSSLKESKGSQVFLWIMTRFLEHGRVMDSFRFFKLQEIARIFTKTKAYFTHHEKMAKVDRNIWQPSGK